MIASPKCLWGATSNSGTHANGIKYQYEGQLWGMYA
jgi:hypothetical protein